MHPIDLIVCTAFGLEAVAARELRALGYDAKGIQPGRLLFKGDMAAICRANMWLRSADRVMVRIDEFEAADFDTLFDRIRELPWERWLPKDAEFPVNGRSIKSQLSSVPACQRAAKKAIVERLKTAHHTAILPETGPRFSIDLSLLKDRVTLAIDTTGASLHKRGYRQLVGAAPLKETMAAALILLSFWRPERPLIDPFCGSGTIPIEAAMIARNMAPGVGREFMAQHWPAIESKYWSNAKSEAHDLTTDEQSLRIQGSDIDRKVLALARHHAKQAGVDSNVVFHTRSFADLASNEPYGCVICNPPYGERIGEEQQIMALYESMEHVLGNLDTWSHYVLTAFPKLEQSMRRKADRKRKLYNGRIECTYYQFHGPRPPRVSETKD